MFRLQKCPSVFATPLVATLFWIATPVVTDAQSDKALSKGKDMTVVGCLIQGDQPRQFEIKGEDKTFLLESRRVKLSKYVGQEVSVSGGLSKKGEQGDMQRFKVSSLSRVSKKSCS
jgi:hypothetical protein